ncbi:MAG: GNAT family N-acetyltransferase [Sphaerochaetaceae bacterium]
MAQLNSSIALRQTVFGSEQGVGVEFFSDESDLICIHVLLHLQQKLVGTLRSRPTIEGMKLERIAIDKAYRGRHLGQLLVQQGVKANNQKSIYIHSQLPVVPFYAALGFDSTTEYFTEAGIEHLKMTLSEENKETLLSRQFLP